MDPLTKERSPDSSIKVVITVKPFDSDVRSGQPPLSKDEGFRTTGPRVCCRLDFVIV